MRNEDELKKRTGMSRNKSGERGSGRRGSGWMESEERKGSFQRGERGTVWKIDKKVRTTTGQKKSDVEVDSAWK